MWGAILEGAIRKTPMVAGCLNNDSVQIGLVVEAEKFESTCQWLVDRALAW